MARVKLNPAERMLASKRRLIRTLRQEIAAVRAQANADVAKIEQRIKIAQTIADALEAGTLKP